MAPEGRVNCPCSQRDCVFNSESLASQLCHPPGLGVGDPPNIPPTSWPASPSPISPAAQRDPVHAHTSPCSPAQNLPWLPSAQDTQLQGPTWLGPSFKIEPLPLSRTQPCPSRQDELERLSLPCACTVSPARGALSPAEPGRLRIRTCFLDLVTPRLQPWSPWDQGSHPALLSPSPCPAVCRERPLEV